MLPNSGSARLLLLMAGWGFFWCVESKQDVSYFLLLPSPLVSTAAVNQCLVASSSSRIRACIIQPSASYMRRSNCNECVVAMDELNNYQFGVNHIVVIDGSFVESGCLYLREQCYKFVRKYYLLKFIEFTLQTYSLWDAAGFG